MSYEDLEKARTARSVTEAEKEARKAAKGTMKVTNSRRMRVQSGLQQASTKMHNASIMWRHTIWKLCQKTRLVASCKKVRLCRSHGEHQ